MTTNYIQMSIYNSVLLIAKQKWFKIDKMLKINAFYRFFMFFN